MTENIENDDLIEAALEFRDDEEVFFVLSEFIVVGFSTLSHTNVLEASFNRRDSFSSRESKESCTLARSLDQLLDQ